MTRARNPTFRVPIRLSYGRSTTALMSSDTSPERLIIFIHGFRGSALKSWGEIAPVIEYPIFVKSDIILFDYDSKYRQVQRLAKDLVHLLRAYTDGDKARDTPYKEIVLVSHSLGSLVARIALNDIFRKENPDWLDKIRLLLFAPAHLGANTRELLRLTGNIPWLGAFARVALIVTEPILQDLSPGSLALKQALLDSKAMLQSGRKNSAIASKVLWADRDWVVRLGRFLEDPSADYIPGTDHQSVVKFGALGSACSEELLKCLK